MTRGWMGVDFDGTLAKYDGFKGAGVYGDPVPLMVQRIKDWLAEGRCVKVVTARAESNLERQAIADWCEQHIGQRLPVQSHKDYAMIELWDDRCVTVEANTGIVLTKGRERG